MQREQAVVDLTNGDDDVAHEDARRRGFPCLPADADTIERLAVAGGLTAVQLYPFQQQGVAFMWSHLPQGGSILADEMGLGKTVQGIALVAALRGWAYEATAVPTEDQTRASNGVVLVLVPVNVLGYWQAQLAQHLPARRVIVVGAGGSLARVAEAGPATVILATHTMFNQNVGLKDNGRDVTFAALANTDVSLVMVDEAHKFMNPATTNHRALLAFRKQQAAAGRCDFALQLLTGTPMGSDPTAVSGYFRLLQKPEWDKAEWWSTTLREDPRRLAAARGFILQRLKRDVGALAMPPKTTEVVNVPMAPHVMPVYLYLMHRVVDLINAIRAEMSRTAPRRGGGRRGAGAGGGGGGAGNAARLRLKQLREWFCAASLRAQDALFAVSLVPEQVLAAGNFNAADFTGDRSTLRTAIVQRVLAHVRATDRGVLLQSYWTRWLRLLKADLEEAGLRVAFFNGSLSAAARVALTNAFQHGEYQVACLTLGCAEGITLTRATCVVDVGYWANPSVHDQGYDRVYRIGQDKPVVVLKFCATTPEGEGTVPCRTMHHAYVATHEARRTGGRAIMTREMDDGGGVPNTSVLMRNIELVATKFIPAATAAEATWFTDEMADGGVDIDFALDAAANDDDDALVV